MDEVDWVKGPYVEVDMGDSEGEGLMAEDAIERLAVALGAKCIGGSIVMAVQQLLTSRDPVHRRSALVACNRFSEGCAATLTKTGDSVRQLAAILVSGLSDSSPRVQFQALQGVGRFALLFPDSISEFLKQFLNPLISFLSAPDAPFSGSSSGGSATSGAVCQRIKGHAAAALINLIDPEALSDEDGEPLRTLKASMSILVTALIRSLQSSSVEVQVPCLGVLGLVILYAVTYDAFCITLYFIAALLKFLKKISVLIMRSSCQALKDYYVMLVK